jgi:predicted aspartyl protease
MGTFKTKLRVWNPARPDEVYEPEVWVDTGAAFSWISRSQLERMGISPLRRIPFRTIEGHLVERDIAAVFIATDGYTGADMVVMADAGDSEVMGAHSIEGLGLAADPVQKKLVPTVMLALTGR